MKGRGDTGQIARAEEQLEKIAHLETKVDLILGQLDAISDHLNIPQANKMERIGTSLDHKDPLLKTEKGTNEMERSGTSLDHKDPLLKTEKRTNERNRRGAGERDDSRRRIEREREKDQLDAISDHLNIPQANKMEKSGTSLDHKDPLLKTEKGTHEMERSGTSLDQKDPLLKTEKRTNERNRRGGGERDDSRRRIDREREKKRRLEREREKD
eukprot:scaffold45387_cov57-Attheya_sp.AAC.2